MIDIRWLYAHGKTFAELAPALSKICDQKNSQVESKLIKYLLEAYWDKYQSAIKRHLMYPYLAYMFANLTFLVYASR